MNGKRIGIVLGALSLICLSLLAITPNTRRYRAASMVVAQPYTNVLLARSFESQAIRTIPAVLSLSAVPEFGTSPGSGAPMVTNGVLIEIVAIGSTATGAEKAADEAARSLCQIISTNYGVSGGVVESAYAARKYSYFHDSLQPAIGRWFKH